MLKRIKIGKGGFIGEVSVIDGELTDLYVHPLRRKRGWAARLVQRAINWADKQGIALRLRICPYGNGGPDKNKLRSFYRGFGFKSVNGDWMIRR